MTTQDWDCHDHRDELFVGDCHTVCHATQGQLCTWSRAYPASGRVRVFTPIRFKTAADAANWIARGYIAEVQEGLSRLEVGFSNVMVAPG